MKILVLSDHFPPQKLGGAESVAFSLTKEFQRRGHTVLVVTTTPDRHAAGRSSYDGLDVIALYSNYPIRLRAYVSVWNAPVVRKVKKILAEFHPDVVHAHNVHERLSYGTLVAAKRTGARVVLTAHDVMSFSYGKLTEFIDRKNLSVPQTFQYKLKPFEQLFSYRLRYNPIRNLVIRHVLKNFVNQVVAVSGALQQAMADNGIRGAAVVHNGVDLKEWEVPESAIAEFKRTHKIGSHALLFGGRLSGIKGGHELLLAFADVVRSIPDAQLLIVGTKNLYAEHMAQIAQERGFDEKLIFTGWLSGEGLHAAYHAAALVATPSLCFDSFATVNLEAMACKKPVISTCFGGSREAIEDGVSGYVVNPFNVPIMAERIKELLADDQKRMRFGKSGYARAREFFQLGACAQSYEALFSR